jgi:hypothetical protein
MDVILALTERMTWNYPETTGTAQMVAHENMGTDLRQF